MSSGVYAVAKASIVSGTTLGLALVTLYLILRTKINPVLVILGLRGVWCFINGLFKIGKNLEDSSHSNHEAFAGLWRKESDSHWSSGELLSI
jgi:hypothetical protein